MPLSSPLPRLSFWVLVGETGGKTKSKTLPSRSRYLVRNAQTLGFAYLGLLSAPASHSQGEAQNSDGQKFISKDNRLTATVYGSNNALRQTLEQILAQNSDDFIGNAIIIEHKEIGNDFFTFSGMSNGNNVEKTLLRHDVIKTLDIEYGRGGSPSMS